MAIHKSGGAPLGTPQTPWKITTIVPLAFQVRRESNGRAIVSAMMPDGTVVEYVTDTLTLSRMLSSLNNTTPKEA